MDTIVADGLTKGFTGAFELGPLTFGAREGEILGIMGPNGAGKTTLLRLLWGFLRPDRGAVLVHGMHPHLEQTRVRLRSGYLSEAPHLYGRLTTAQFLRF